MAAMVMRLPDIRTTIPLLAAELIAAVANRPVPDNSFSPLIATANRCRGVVAERQMPFRLQTPHAQTGMPAQLVKSFSPLMSSCARSMTVDRTVNASKTSGRKYARRFRESLVRFGQMLDHFEAITR